VRALLGAAVLAAVLSPLALAQEEPTREGSVAREVRVGRVEVDAYVTDRNGDAIPDLSPADFVVKVDGARVAVEAADWIPAERSEGALAGEPAGEALPPDAPAPAAAVPYPPGRLIVLFFQLDYYHSRLLGLVRMANQAIVFLDRLLPTDRVAVLSYDSQLKLRQDFTDDRELLRRAIGECLKAGPPASPDPTRTPSLAALYDTAAAKKAATPERGLAVAARALAGIPGAKSLLFFGWGLRINQNPREDRDYADALRALSVSRTNLFALDVTDADYHTLEIELMRTAEYTGGTYQKTHEFPQTAIGRVARAIAGRYVLVLVKPEGKRGAHEVAISLAKRKGQVNARSYYED
jgi:VWFA-related protein